MKKKTYFKRIMMVLVALVLCATKASAQEAYVHYDADEYISSDEQIPSESITATFYYDNNIESRPGVNIKIQYWGYWMLDHYDKKTKRNTTDVVIDASFANYRPTDMQAWFDDMEKITTIVGIENLKTDEVTNMRAVFYGCNALTDLDITHFNTEKVKNMKEMFEGCRMLKSLDLSNFNTQNVTDMSYMFCGCRSLTQLDLSSFNTERAQYMGWMFSSCEALATIIVGENWNAYWPTYHSNAGKMFEDCYSLIGGAGTVFDENHIGGQYAHVDSGSDNPGYLTAQGTLETYAALSTDGKTLTFYSDIKRSEHPNSTYSLNTGGSWPGWYSKAADITNVVFDRTFSRAHPTSTASWFHAMSNLTSITGLDYLNTDEVTDMSYMFCLCSNMRSIDVSLFNTEKVTNMAYMFDNCSRLTTLDLSNFNTQKVTNMSCMFRKSNNLTTIKVGREWSTAKVTSSTNMFTDCTVLHGGNGTTYDASHVDKGYARIDGDTGYPGYLSSDALHYGIRVGGVAVTEWNTSDIMGNGAATFDPATHTLTLTNATITNNTTYGAIYTGNDYAFSNLTIQLVGSNVIQGNSLSDISLSKNTTVTGSGSLTGWGTCNVNYGKTLTVSGGCSLSGAAITASNNSSTLTVKGANTQVQLTNNITGFANVTLQNGLVYSKPVGGSYDTTNCYVVNAYGNRATGVTISNQANYGLKVAGINVTSQNASGITGSGISGTVTFDADTRTLTLTNATITSSSYEGITNSGTSYAFNDLTIQLVGNNTINVGDRNAVMLATNGAITGSGTLTADHIKITSGKELTICGGSTVNAYDVRGVQKTETLLLRNAQTHLEVSTNIYGFASVTLEDGLLISTPSGGYYDTTNKYVVKSNGSSAVGVVIDNDTDFDYNLIIAGVAVKVSNAANITGTGITGKVSYNPDTHTLTLTNATITSSTAGGIDMDSDYPYEDLTIKLVGDNTINTSGTGNTAVSLLRNTTISGTGTLTLANNGRIRMLNAKTLTIEGGCVLNAYRIQNYRNYNPTLVVKGADTEVNLTNTISGYRSVTLEDGLLFVKPDGGSYDATNMYVVDKDGNESTDGVIIKRVPYVVYNSSTTTLTFYQDGQRASHNGTVETVYYLNEGENAPGWRSDGTHENVTKVVFHESFASARPTSTTSWFANMSNLTTITGIENLNTSQVTSMRSMFYNCSALTTLDVSHFNTQNVTSMRTMFYSCSGLTTLNLSSFNTQKVENMYMMFMNCQNLTALDVSSFNTSRVTDMSNMFQTCKSLTTLDLSNFNTQNVTSMIQMFYYCENLMNVDVSSFNTAAVTTMWYMFGTCPSLTTLDLSSFNTQSVTNMSYMFVNGSSLKTIYVGDGWSTAGLTGDNSSTSMFGSCTSLVGGKGTKYNSAHVDKAYAHIDGGRNNPGYLSKIGDFLLGDVNCDGEVTIADVTALDNIILGNPTGNENENAADMNEDGSITTSDVKALVKMILRK